MRACTKRRIGSIAPATDWWVAYADVDDSGAPKVYWDRVVAFAVVPSQELELDGDDYVEAMVKADKNCCSLEPASLTTNQLGIYHANDRTPELEAELLREAAAYRKAEEARLKVVS